ncbi:MAG: CRTAC1 family protein [Abditibacteriales bacterium]|nr:CRTAC1 family protein [Abditibacteriales bacterium]MDW8364838.1 CRTAC1 family protein [Abditibacteriales bacterium]
MSGIRRAKGAGRGAATLGVALFALRLLLPLALGGCQRSRPSDALFAPSSAATMAQTVTSPAQFADVTERAGIRFKHTSGAQGELHLPETMGSGCAFFDFDNDGWLDIFFVNSKPIPHCSPPKVNPPPTLALYHNNRDGTFTDVTTGSGLDVSLYGMGCAIGDYDNDGRDDVLVTTCLEGHRLFRNEGQGKFKDVTPEIFKRHRRWGTSAAWVDYDNDGWLDLFVCNYVPYHWTDDVRCNYAEGYLSYCNPRYFPPETCSLYRNEGNGRFRDVSEAAGITRATAKALGVCVLDYDDDGWMDIAVASDTTRNLLFHNLGNGTFEEVALSLGVAFAADGKTRAGMGIDAADLDNDGRLGLLISNFSEEGLSLFHQDQPRGMFSDISHVSGVWQASYNLLGFGLFFFDYDDDGLSDALVVNGHIQPRVQDYSPHTTYAERKLLFRNLGGGRFAEVGSSAGQPFVVQRVSRGAACGDYDNDGDLDVLVSNNNQPAELLRNVGGTGNNWIEIELQGRSSNRNGIGAKVTVTAGGKTQTQWLRSGSSYCSQSALRLHFGLGKASRVERVRVRWSNRKEETFEVSEVNQRVRLVEGTGRPVRG